MEGEILQFIFILAINMAAGYFIYRFMGCFLEFRENKLFRAGMVISLAFIGGTVILAGDAFNICAALSAFLLAVLLCTKGSIFAKLAVVMIIYPLTAGMGYMVSNNFFYQNIIRNWNTEVYSEIRVLLYYIFTTLIKAGIWAGIYYIFRERLTRLKLYMGKQNWLYVLTIGVCSLIAILCVAISPPAVYVNFEDDMAEFPVMGWLMVLAVLVTNLGVIALLPVMIDSVHSKQEEQKAGIREEYYLSLEQQQEKIRKLRHDMNNHFQMLQTYLAQGDAGKAREYLEQLNISALQYGGRRFCRDTALNAMLNDRYDKLTETGADVHFNLSIPEINGIENVDLCTILSNSLDNAIEAVKKIRSTQERKVSLKAVYEKGYFSCRLANSKCNQITVQNGRYLSDKPEKNHGYGIENMKAIVEKYGGRLHIEYTEKEFILFLYINEE